MFNLIMTYILLPIFLAKSHDDTRDSSVDTSSTSAESQLEELLVSLKVKDSNRFACNILFDSQYQIIIFSIAPYKCPFCPNKFVSMPNAVEHVGFLHPDWREKHQNSSGLVNQDKYDMRGNENRGEESNSSMAGEGETRMLSQDVVGLDVVGQDLVDLGMGGQDLVGLYMVGQDGTVTEAKQDSSTAVKPSANVHSPNWFHDMRSSFQVEIHFSKS